jgi:hypothetical protein
MILDWLIITFAFELGWVPTGELLMYDREYIIYMEDKSIYYPMNVNRIDGANTFYTDFDLNLMFFDFVYVEGGLRVMVHKTEEGISFSPDAIYYRFGAGFQFDFLTVFWEHHCYHPQMCYMFAYKPLLNWEGWYDEIGVRLEFSTRREIKEYGGVR